MRNITETNDVYGLIGTRVELAPYTDQWMRGDRYGVITGVAINHVRVKLDKSGKTIVIHGDAVQPI